MVALIAVPVFAILIYTLAPKQGGSAEAAGMTDAQLASASVSDLEPRGELADIFSLFSDATEIQRDEKERQIKGKIVRWRLPVYNVSERNGFYVIQTEGSGLVSTFCYVRANDENKSKVLSLRENDLINCKGQIAGSSMRSIEIRPAVLQ